LKTYTHRYNILLILKFDKYAITHIYNTCVYKYFKNLYFVLVSYKFFSFN